MTAIRARFKKQAKQQTPRMCPISADPILRFWRVPRDSIEPKGGSDQLANHVMVSNSREEIIRSFIKRNKNTQKRCAATNAMVVACQSSKVGRV